MTTQDLQAVHERVSLLSRSHGRDERCGVRIGGAFIPWGLLFGLTIFRVELGCLKRNRVRAVVRKAGSTGWTSLSQAPGLISSVYRSSSSVYRSSSSCGRFRITWRAASFSAAIFLRLQQAVYFLDQRP
jgi:hypothetical protein